MDAVEGTRREFVSLLGDAPATGDLARGALLVGRVVEPNLDIAAGLDQLAALGEASAASDPAALALELFGSGRLRGNPGDYYDPANSVMTSVIDRGLGIPITLSVVFIDVADRLGFAVEGVGMPGHFLTRAGERFFDPFHAGIELDADGCQRLYERLAGRPVALPPRALESVSVVDILRRMLWNLRSIAEGRGDAAMTLRVLSLLSATPDAPLQVRMSWARALADRGRFGEAALTVENLLDQAPEKSRERLQALADRWAARLN